MDVHVSISSGQQEARTRWGTHASGAAFDCKKSPYLTEQAREFIAQQAICVIAGLGPANEPGGLLAMGEPGFVQTPDSYTCLLQMGGRSGAYPTVQGLHQSRPTDKATRLGLLFI